MKILLFLLFLATSSLADDPPDEAKLINLQQRWQHLSESIDRLQKSVDSLTEEVDNFSQQLADTINEEARSQQPTPSPTPGSNE